MTPAGRVGAWRLVGMMGAFGIGFLFMGAEGLVIAFIVILLMALMMGEDR